MEELQKINAKVDIAQRDLSERLDKLSDSVSKTKKSVDDLSTKCTRLEKENTLLKADITHLSDKLDYLENQGRRNNLLFHGIAKSTPNETWSDCEDYVRDVLRNKMKMDDSLITIERAHRLNHGKSIIIKLLDFNMKKLILQETRTLKGTGIYISEDFSYQVRRIRKNLKSIMDTERENGRKSKLRFDKLIFEDGEVVRWDTREDKAVYSRGGNSQQSDDSHST